MERVWLAGGPGFEPGLSGSEPLVLPLNYPPVGPLLTNDDLICHLAQEKAILVGLAPVR